MKDAYSFDRDEAGLDESFRKHEARTTASSSAAASRCFAVEAESGMMGGSGSRSTSSHPPARARTRSSPARTATTQRISRSRAAFPRAPEFPESLAAPEEVETPGVTTIEALAEFLGVDAAATSKAMPVVDRRRHASCSRSSAATTGSSEAKLVAALGRRRRARRPERDPRSVRRRPRLARPGRLRRSRSSPTRRCAKASSSPARTATGWHLRGVEAGRDFEARFADLRESERGRHVPALRRALRFQTAIEVGHIFKLGTRYSVPLERDVPRRGRAGAAAVMGSYGIGPGRVMAAVVEQRHDEHGIIVAARRSRRTTCTWSRCPARRRSAEQAAAGARDGGRRRPARRSRPRAPARSSPTPI